jgi:hypothetical protein
LHNQQVLDALTNRHSLVLSPRDWRRFLRTDEHGELREFDAMINRAGEALALLEETEVLLGFPTKEDIEERCTSFIEAYVSAIQRLHEWQERLRRASNKPLYWAVPTKLSHPDDLAGDIAKTFPLVLEFQSLKICVLLIFSWAVELQIYCSLIRVSHLLPNPQETESSGTTRTHDVRSDIAEADKLARLICQSLEYCHRIDMGMLAPQGTTYPTWVVKRYLKYHPGHERELRWCENFKSFKGPGSRCEVVMMIFSDSAGVLGDVEVMEVEGDWRAQ